MPREPNFELNNKEEAVLAAFPPALGDAGPSISIAELAAKAFRKKGSSPGTKGNSWVRNSLRRLVKFGLVKRGANRQGRYCRTGVELSDLKAKQEEARA